MAGRGETVKYIIDADTSGFSRGMLGAAAESEIAGKRIDRALSRTSKRGENNFQDIRKNAATAASSIRNFGVAFQAFNTTSAIIGITALSGALLELSGAIAAAGSTVSVLVPLLAQGGAAAFALKAGVSGLGDAFKAIGKNDGEAFAKSMSDLGPAARQVAFAVAGLNKAFNSIKLNTQQALLEGVGDALLQLGANTLPIVNAGFQLIGQSMNRAFKQATALAGSPAFSGLLATIFSDTSRTIDTLSGAIGPLLTIFTNLYLITAPYVQLLSEFIVNLTKSGAAYLSSAKGQQSLNLAIAQGVIALQQIGDLIGSVFGLLTSIFRTSITSGTSMISTIVGIVDAMTDWVNSAKGQAQLAALFQFTALTVQTVAGAIGQALQAFFNILQAVNSLNPALQQMIVGFLASSLVLRPVLSYFSQLYLAIRVVAVTAFNFIQQAFVVASALGTVASIVVVLAAGLIILGSVIKGPLGSAFIIIGVALATYIALSYVMTLASNAAAAAMIRQGQANIALAGSTEVVAFATNMATVTLLGMATAAGAAGTGLSLAARGAMFLQAALLPLIVLASGVLIILGMLGVFSGKAQQAQGASIGLGSSLSSLQKSLKGVGASGNKSTGGLSALSDSLSSVGDAADTAQGGLAAFDKMNVLQDSSSAKAGIPAVPSLPASTLGDMGGVAAPTIDTGDFDKQMADMSKQFGDLQKQFGEGFPNPFKAIGEFITANPLPFFIAFAVILGIIIALFVTGAVSISLATLPLTLIVVAIIAIIAIIILLVQNWDAVWKTIVDIATAVWDWIKTAFKAVGDFIGGVFKSIGDFFATIFAAIWAGIQWYINLYIEIFKLAFSIITTVWNAIVDFFKGLWNGIVAVFSVVGKFFGDVFSNAWNAVKNAFGAVASFFQGIWNTIVGIFGKVGTAVGDAIGGAFKSVVNTVLNIVSGIVNTVIDLINGAINLINKIPGVNIGKIPRMDLPRLAKGGVVSSPTTAVIGEAGEEAVMPLENNTE